MFGVGSGIMTAAGSYLAGTWRWKAAVPVPLVAPGDTADIFRLKVEVMLK